MRNQVSNMRNYVSEKLGKESNTTNRISDTINHVVYIYAYTYNGQFWLNFH